MTRDIFKSSDLQKRLREEGYVVVPLLSTEELELLRQIYADLQSGSEVQLSFYTSIWSENERYRDLVDSRLKAILVNALEKYLQQCKSVFANFMVKHPGENSQLIPHQDWNFVDEACYDSVTVWCPLVDVNETNGNLQVIPGSHQLRNFIRGRFFDAPFQNLFDEVVYHRLKNVVMKAGEALVLNSRLIHASPPNHSASTRVVASVVMAPAEAELIHYVLEDNISKTTYKKLPITPEFFTNYSCYDSLASVSSDERFPYSFQAMTKEEFLSAIGQGDKKSINC